MNMNKIVSITHPYYGKCELNVEKIIALFPEHHKLVFENYYWTLDSDDFNKVSELWHKLNSI